MKILQIISYFYPAWSYGGPGKLAYDLSKELVKLKNQVTVYTTDAFSQYQRRHASDITTITLTNLNLKVFRNLSNFLAFRFKFFLPLINLFVIKRQIRQFDIIHIHEFFTLLTIIVFYFASKYKIPYLISAHGTLDFFHLQHRPNIKKIYMYLFGKKILNNASALIAATMEEIDEYILLGKRKDKIFFIPNGIDLSEFSKLPNKNLFRRKYKLSDKTKIILYLGRINHLKGLDVLLKAFAEIVNQLDCHLVIAGSDDGYLSHLKQITKDLKISDKVIFPGVLSGQDKLTIYVDSDVFIYPSPAEGFSIAILEAAAAGLPLVITKGCKFPQVEKQKAGIIVPFKEEKMVQALVKLLKNNNLRKKAALNALKMVRENFAIVIMTQKLTDLYQKLAL